MIVTVDAIVETGFAGSNWEDTLEIEVPDNASQEEIEKIVEEEVKEWAMNHISIGFTIKETK